MSPDPQGISGNEVSDDVGSSQAIIGSGTTPNLQNLQKRLEDAERLVNALDIKLQSMGSKQEIEALRGQIDRSAGELIKWALGAVLALLFGLGSMIFAMTNAMKAPVPIAAATPIIITLPASPAISQPPSVAPAEPRPSTAGVPTASPTGTSSPLQTKDR